MTITGVAGLGDRPPPSTPSRASIRALPRAGRAGDAPATWSITSIRWRAVERTRPATCNGRRLRRAKPRTRPKAGADNFARRLTRNLPSHTSFRASQTNLLHYTVYKKRDVAISPSFQFNLSYPPTLQLSVSRRAKPLRFAEPHRVQRVVGRLLQYQTLLLHREG